MKRGLVVVALAALLAVPALAGFSLRLGVAFLGVDTLDPAITLETGLRDSLSAKLFLIPDSELELIATVRRWSYINLALTNGTASSLSHYIGFGIIATRHASWEYSVVGPYAEAGMRLTPLEMGLAAEWERGALPKISLSLGISFDVGW